MSNKTHIKWNGNYRGKRKYNDEPWKMDHRAIRTICDREDRNYKPREHHRDREEYDRRRGPERRHSTREGLFRNAKESSLIINNLPSAVRRNVENEVAQIVAPNDSVEFVRPSLDQIWSNTHNGNRNYDRKDTDMRSRSPESRYRHSQMDNSRDRRRDYEERRSPRRYSEFRRPYNYYNHRDKGDHYRGTNTRRSYADLGRERHQDDYRRRAQSVLDRNAHDNRRSRRDFHDDRHSRYSKPCDIFSTLQRRNSYRRSPARSPQLPSMFASGYRPVPMSRKIVEESPFCSPNGQYSAISNLEKFNDYTERLKSLPATQLSQTVEPAEYEASLTVAEEDPEVVYPAERVAERILVAVPKIPLKDDSNDRYGATARDLLKCSIKALLSSSSKNHAPMRDLLNRTTRLSYNTYTQEERFGDVASENLFQPDQPSCIQEMYSLSPPPTPEREKQFNKTLIEELHIGDPELDEIEASALISQQPVAPAEVNANIWEDSNWINNSIAVNSSPADISFFRDMEQMSNPVPQELNFDPSTLFQ